MENQLLAVPTEDERTNEPYGVLPGGLKLLPDWMMVRRHDGVARLMKHVIVIPSISLIYQIQPSPTTAESSDESVGICKKFFTHSHTDCAKKAPAEAHADEGGLLRMQKVYLPSGPNKTMANWHIGKKLKYCPNYFCASLSATDKRRAEAEVGQYEE